MIKGFWEKLKKPVSPGASRGGPIMALAPMANVTDAAFRRIIVKYGKFTRPDGTPGGGPDVMFTEFVSCEGLLSEGREKLLMDLWYSEAERPIVAQIFGAKPEQFYQVAQLCQELGFDGIDINMGCPDKGIMKSGSCAALIQTPELAKKIIAETKRGAGNLPVSVKTRIGFNKNEIETWLPHLLEAEPAAIIIHARTKKEMSDVPAHWDQIARAAQIINDQFSISKRGKPLLLGNGDVNDLTDARRLASETGADGIMLGRAIFGNPFLFAEQKCPANGAGIPYTNVPRNYGISVEERLRVAVEHTKLFMEIFGDPSNPSGQVRKPFDIMKKHFKAYVSGFDGAKELRMKMMEAKTSQEIEHLIDKFLSLLY